MPYTIEIPKPRPTRFKELGYRQDDHNLWRIVDLTDSANAAIGPHYSTKAELMADLERFARLFGCEYIPA